MAQTYTPNPDANASPTFGTSGPSVLALQQQLNAQHANEAGYVPLKLDSKFGPLTQAAMNFAKKKEEPKPENEGRQLNQPVPEKRLRRVQGEEVPIETERDYQFKSLLKSSQNLIDSIYKGYNQQLKTTRGATSGAIAGAGLQGSSAAGSAVIEAQKPVLAEREQTLQTVYKNIQDTALEEADKAKVSANESIKTLAANHIDWDEYKKTNPENYQALVRSMGGDENVANALFASSIPPDDIKKTWYTNDGGTMNQLIQDPVTGKPQVLSFDLGTKVPPDWEHVSLGTGKGMLFYDPANPSNNRIVGIGGSGGSGTGAGTLAVPTTYTVKPTDTGGLFQIAQNNGFDFEALKAANPQLGAEFAIKPGDTVHLPVSQYDQPELAFLKGKTPEQVGAYNSLDSIQQSNVSQLLNGDALLTDLISSRGVEGTAQRQKLIQDARKVDPTFSENTNKIRYAYNKDWNDATTNIGKTKVSINTALNHLADVSELSKKLNPSQLNFINNKKNWWDKETGDPDILNLQFGITQLASEIATAYKGGTAPTDSEIEAEKKVLGAELSRAQFEGVQDVVARFLSGKISSLNYNYQSTMGHNPPQSVIDPQARQNLINAGIDPNAISADPNSPSSESSFQLPDGTVLHLQADGTYS